MNARIVHAGLAPLAIIAILLASCSQKPVTTQSDAEGKIRAGRALNARTGSYAVGGVEVTLMKVVDLPGDELGMQFTVRWDSAALPTCCNLFPHMALYDRTRQQATGGFGGLDVVEDRSSIAADGTLDMLLTGGQPVQRLGRFTVDLASLGVSGFSANG